MVIGSFRGIKDWKEQREEKERRQEIAQFSRHVHITQTGSQIVP